ncbi:hypothetical protein Emed_002284 [Eimeria media]
MTGAPTSSHHHPAEGAPEERVSETQRPPQKGASLSEGPPQQQTVFLSTLPKQPEIIQPQRAPPPPRSRGAPQGAPTPCGGPPAPLGVPVDTEKKHEAAAWKPPPERASDQQWLLQQQQQQEEEDEGEGREAAAWMRKDPYGKGLTSAAAAAAAAASGSCGSTAEEEEGSLLISQDRPSLPAALRPLEAPSACEHRSNSSSSSSSLLLQRGEGFMGLNRGPLSRSQGAPPVSCSGGPPCAGGGPLKEFHMPRSFSLSLMECSKQRQSSETLLCQLSPRPSATGDPLFREASEGPPQDEGQDTPRKDAALLSSYQLNSSSSSSSCALLPPQEQQIIPSLAKQLLKQGDLTEAPWVSPPLPAAALRRSSSSSKNSKSSNNSKGAPSGAAPFAPPQKTISDEEEELEGAPTSLPETLRAGGGPLDKERWLGSPFTPPSEEGGPHSAEAGGPSKGAPKGLSSYLKRRPDRVVLQKTQKPEVPDFSHVESVVKRDCWRYTRGKQQQQQQQEKQQPQQQQQQQNKQLPLQPREFTQQKVQQQQQQQQRNKELQHEIQQELLRYKQQQQQQHLQQRSQPEQQQQQQKQQPRRAQTPTPEYDQTLNPKP